MCGVELSSIPYFVQYFTLWGEYDFVCVWKMNIQISSPTSLTKIFYPPFDKSDSGILNSTVAEFIWFDSYTCLTADNTCVSLTIPVYLLIYQVLLFCQLPSSSLRFLCTHSLHWVYNDFPICSFSVEHMRFPNVSCPILFYICYMYLKPLDF